MMTDKDIAEIEQQRRAGAVPTPLVWSWIDRLIADRRERVEQLQHARARLRQAFEYLDGLLAASPARPPATAPKKAAANLSCPRCRQPYERAYGISPSGVAYVHAGQRECRT